MGLEQWGWSPWFAKRASGLPGEPGRVALVHRDRCSVLTAQGEIAAPVSGHVRDSHGAPAVGDWVTIHAGSIDAILPRRTLFSRQRDGAEQPLAANLDVMFVVCGLDRDFNLRRIERYLVLAGESGAEAAVVLNKADLRDDPEEALAQVRGVSAGAPVLLMSARDGVGVEAMESLIGPGRTGVLIGSSGAGKSTLLNRLLRAETMVTQPVRESDSRGRHTTTARHLFALPSGGLLIDMPGIREVGLWATEEGLARAFPDIGDAASQCRFRDCRHEDEPGCAVREAADGKRLESYRKLRREVEWLERREDPAKEAAHRKKMRSIHKAIRDPR